MSEVMLRGIYKILVRICMCAIIKHDYLTSKYSS
jgi:hypothetical protein